MAHRPSPRRLRYRVGSKHQSQLSRRLRLDFARIATHLRPPGPLAVIRASFPSSDSVVCDTQERAAGSARTWALDIIPPPPPRAAAGPRRPRACLDRRRSAELGRSRVPTPVVYKRFFVFNTDRPARPPAREWRERVPSPRHAPRHACGVECERRGIASAFPATETARPRIHPRKASTDVRCAMTHGRIRARLHASSRRQLYRLFGNGPRTPSR